MPLLKLASTGLKVQESGPTIPDVPLLLLELEQVERWGLPNEGTWLDQPVEYMTDLESVRLARDGFKATQNAEKEVDIAGIFASAPAPKSAAG